MSKKYNNADTVLEGDLQASGLAFVVKDWEGALFPETADAPYKLTHEHYEGINVTKREILTISARSGDAFTVSARATETCVQDDTATPKTRTANALSFVSGDRVFMSNTEEDANDLETEVYTNIPADIEQAKTDLLAEIQKGNTIYGASSSGTDAYAITLDPVPASLASLKGLLLFLTDVGNTGPATLNVNGLGAKTIKKANDVDLGDGDIEALQVVTVVYNATDDVFEMVSQISTLPTVDINGLTAKNPPADADSYMMYDSVAGANKKVTHANLKSAILGGFTGDAVQYTFSSTGSFNVSHNLGRVPSMILAFAGFSTGSNYASNSWGAYDWVNNYCVHKSYGTGGNTSSLFRQFYSTDSYGSVTAKTTTNFTVSYAQGTDTSKVTFLVL